MDDKVKTLTINPLADIIDGSKSNGDTVFNCYKSKTDIAKLIFEQLNKKVYDLPKDQDERKMGFSMDNDRKNIGLLSQCQSLQALVSLASDFGLSFKDDNIIPGQKGTIREIMDAVIEDVIVRIEVRNENNDITGYKFDASPYDSAHFTEKYSNIDTITWVITTFLLILKYHASKEVGEICKWEERLIAAIKHGMKYLIDAYITKKENDDSKGLRQGWNFTKDCEEPSLYFTFTVSECYLDIFGTFADVLAYPYAVRNNKKYGVAIDPKVKNIYDEKLEQYNIDEKKDRLGNKAKHNTYNELVRIYKKINDIDEEDEIRIDGTLYGNLASLCEEMAETVWGFVKKDMADKFFYNDLAKTLTEDDLRTSTTSDALFNTVYIINIMLDGGYDELLRLRRYEQELKGNFDEVKKLQREFDNFYESCQLAIQKAFRTYESLKNDSKEYIVDQFLVGFNEKFEKLRDKVGELRKLRMKCFSLLPMLIHTNNIVNEYLVQYPQYNMQKYLQYILDNRYTKDNKKYWIWETDGYFCGSNYYFIYALKEFYVYYDKYEQKCIENAKDNKGYNETIEKEYELKLKEPEGLIFNLETELNESKLSENQKDKQIAELQAKIDSFSTPVEDSVRGVVDQQLEKRFEELMMKTFEDAAVSLIPINKDKTGNCFENASNVKESVLNMLMAGFVAYYLTPKSRSVKSVDEYNKLVKKFKKHINSVSADLISEATNKATDDKK